LYLSTSGKPFEKKCHNGVTGAQKWSLLRHLPYFLGLNNTTCHNCGSKKYHQKIILYEVVK
jgi:hypothetical protein